MRVETEAEIVAIFSDIWRMGLETPIADGMYRREAAASGEGREPKTK
jgi:hypothetical protein